MILSDETLKVWANGGFADGNATVAIAQLAAELIEARDAVRKASAILSAKSPILEELELIDRATDGILLGDPAHTLSYNIAKRAAEGHFLATELCKALSLFSPNHCANALAKESTEAWRKAIDEVG